MLGSVATVECLVTATPSHKASHSDSRSQENPLIQAAYENHEELLQLNSDPRKEVVQCKSCGKNFLRDKRARKQPAYCPLTCSHEHKKSLGWVRVTRFRGKQRSQSKIESPKHEHQEQREDEYIVSGPEEIIASPTGKSLLDWFSEASEFELSPITCDKLRGLRELSPSQRRQLLVSLSPWQTYAYSLSAAIGLGEVHCDVIQDAILLAIVKRNINSAHHAHDSEEGFDVFKGRKLKCRPPPRS